MISKFRFKDTEAFTIENEKASVIILPRIGGKIASFYHKEMQFELLDQNPQQCYEEASVGDPFELYDTSGFDDCFPSIDQSTEIFEGQEVMYPDHGELWSGRFDCHVPSEESDRLTLRFKSQLLPYIFEKDISLNNTTLTVDYRITNCGNSTINGFYTMHCLARCEEDMQIFIGDDVKEVINAVNSQYLGESGTKHPYPVTADTSGKPYQLNRVFGPTAGKYEKYYAVNPITDGKCGLYYPSSQVMFQVTYDTKKLPYLGFWVTEGGFKNSYNCALEPSSGFYDSMPIAKANGKYNRIQPGETFEFDLKLTLA